MCHQGVKLDSSTGWDEKLGCEDGAKEKGEVGEVPLRMDTDLTRMITG